MLYLDTSVLVPLFEPDPLPEKLRAWFASDARLTLAISDWTLTEFASAMGIKVRDKGLKSDQARRARALMQNLADESLKVFTPSRADFLKAADYLAKHALGLRAGDALHLAIAQNDAAARLYTLDRRRLDAANKLKCMAAGPI